MVSMSINWNIMKDNLKMDLNMDTANLPTLIKNILVILLIIYMNNICLFYQLNVYNSHFLVVFNKNFIYLIE